jgi:DNA polymerase-1
LRVIFDIETNGLLYPQWDKKAKCMTTPMDKVHCITAHDIDANKAYDFRPHEVEEGVRFLMEADVLIGHNILAFDIPALKKVYPWFETNVAAAVDTMVLSRLIWSNLADRDYAQLRRAKTTGFTLGKNMPGSHSLDAWGHRLGVLKGGYTGGWDEWSEDMHAYAIQDVVVTKSLYELIQTKGYSQQAIDLEHTVARVMAGCTVSGITFDAESAEKLTEKLVIARAELEDTLRQAIDPWWSKTADAVGKRTTNSRKDPSKPGYWKDAKYTKVQYNVFNPGSRHHIADRLQALFGWKPTEYTADGHAKVDETMLTGLDYPACKLIVNYLTLQKRLGQLAEGNKAWLKFENNTGVIHAQYNTNGAVTGRATHMDPNVGQVPSIGALYGKDCRSLFGPRKGRKMVGVDLSGLELRCLAHYMHKYDDGVYGKLLLEGDVHTANQLAAGLPTRDMAKTFIYGFLYGAGAEKIGSIVQGGSKEGAELKKRFLQKTPALKKLIDQVKKTAKMRGFVRGLDGRLIYIRHIHASLNSLLQSAGALIAKQWIAEIDRDLRASGLHDRCAMLCWVHDEVQYECDPEVAEEVKVLIEQAALKAGEVFNFRIPTEAEGKIGNNWAETH